jgi:3-isopropylmalate/(R)-2-methylmalate dehydratase large subunit
VIEEGLAASGSLMLGATSHAVTYGAVNAFATGIGSSDLAAILISGESSGGEGLWFFWLRVPRSIRVTLTARGVC